MAEIAESIINAYDLTQNEQDSEEPLGALLFHRLVKEFDKHFLLNNGQSSLKTTVSNAMKCLLAFSDSAKKAALNGNQVFQIYFNLNK